MQQAIQDARCRLEGAESVRVLYAVEFASLVAEQLPTRLQPLVHALLDRKRSGEELAAGPRIPELNDFLDAELARLAAGLAKSPRHPVPDWEALDRRFRGSLSEVWGGAVELSRGTHS